MADEVSRPGQEYLYEMHWRPGLVWVHWRVELHPQAGERPRAGPEIIASGRSFTLDGAIVQAARVIHRERATTALPGQRLSETEVLHRAAAIGLSNAH